MANQFLVKETMAAMKALSAAEIAHAYKRRWDIEVFSG